MLFYYGTAPAHSSRIVAAKLEKFRYALLPPPPYLPDLAQNRTGKRGSQKKISDYLNKQVILETEAYLAEFNVFFVCLEVLVVFFKMFKESAGRWVKCILLEADSIR